MAGLITAAPMEALDSGRQSAQKAAERRRRRAHELERNATTIELANLNAGDRRAQITQVEGRTTMVASAVDDASGEARQNAFRGIGSPQHRRQLRQA